MPVKTTAPIAGSAARSVSAAHNARRVAVSSAFSDAGRFNASTATGPSRSTTSPLNAAPAQTSALAGSYCILILKTTS
jgi:hypothetical protein